MKKLSFLTGFVAAILIFALAIPVLAATGLTITVNTDMKIMVDNKVFKPKNAGGEDVMTFEYDGTTYVPLRALAEAYGLEVGYNQEQRMATVNKPGAPAFMSWTAEELEDYERFMALWSTKVAGESITLTCSNETSMLNYVAMFAEMGDGLLYNYAQKIIYDSVPNYKNTPVWGVSFLHPELVAGGKATELWASFINSDNM